MEGKKICEYGCGKEAKYKFKNGKWCCSESWAGCPVKKKNNSKQHIGQLAWNKNLKNCYSKKTIKKMSKSRKGISPWNKGKKSVQIAWNKGKFLSISKIKKRYPTFAKIEEMRYNPDKPYEKEIQVHCKNHNCPNSKEQGGWFTPPNGEYFRQRMYSIETDTGNGYYYCSDECKEECPLYKKHVTQLIKEDQINAGILEDPWYTSQEYKTWRDRVFELDDSKCVWCEKPATIAHHILPQKTHPELSLDPENGVACCQECHYKYGHRDRWCTIGYLNQLVCERKIKVIDKI